MAGRRRDRIFVQDLDDVAALLGVAGPDVLRRRIADDARAVAYAVDDALRAAERWLAAQRQRLTARASSTHQTTSARQAR